jgi:hypothetical protein
MSSTPAPTPSTPAPTPPPGTRISSSPRSVKLSTICLTFLLWSFMSI